MKKSDVELINSVARINNRVAVKKYYYDELPKDIRGLAFAVSNLESLRTIQMVQRSLQNAIDEGTSFENWRSNLDQSVLKNLTDARLETVYRTNVNTVYNQSARYNSFTSGVTPYLMYTAVGDERTRPEHMKLDGVTKRADSAFWETHLPPISFNCRCGVIPLSKEDADEVGISRRANNSFPEPAEGFGKSKMGDVLSGVTKAADEALESMKPSELKDKFQDSQANIKSLVDIWFDKNKNIFK